MLDRGAVQGAGGGRRIVPDDAGWHPEPGLRLPEGIRLVHPPRCSPELQPAEPRGPLLAEPLVNRHPATLAEVDQVVARRGLDPDADRAPIEARTRFHRWPTPRQPA